MAGSLRVYLSRTSPHPRTTTRRPLARSNRPLRRLFFRRAGLPHNPLVSFLGLQLILLDPRPVLIQLLLETFAAANFQMVAHAANHDLPTQTGLPQHPFRDQDSPLAVQLLVLSPWKERLIESKQVFIRNQRRRRLGRKFLKAVMRVQPKPVCRLPRHNHPCFPIALPAQSVSELRGNRDSILRVDRVLAESREYHLQPPAAPLAHFNPFSGRMLHFSPRLSSVFLFPKNPKRVHFGGSEPPPNTKVATPPRRPRFPRAFRDLRGSSGKSLIKRPPTLDDGPCIMPLSHSHPRRLGHALPLTMMCERVAHQLRESRRAS